MTTPSPELPEPKPVDFVPSQFHPGRNPKARKWTELLLNNPRQWYLLEIHVDDPAVFKASPTQRASSSASSHRLWAEQNPPTTPKGTKKGSFTFVSRTITDPKGKVEGHVYGQFVPRETKREE